MKKILNYLKNIKITYKLFFIFAILIYILINSWFFSFTTAKDVEESFNKLETYTLPYLLTTNNLKDNLHTSLLAAYDYISTGNEDSKALYTNQIRSTLESSIYLFEISQTQEDLEFTSNFINEQTTEIKKQADNLISKYEENPDNPDVSENLKELTTLRNDFNNFLEGEVNLEMKNQVQTASDFINDRANQITYALIGVITIVIIIIILLVLFISNNITKPVKKLTKAASDFGKGEFNKVELNRKDELGVFAETFNKMGSDILTKEKALQEELSKTKELDKQKSEFLSIAAHQLRTPMSGIKWLLQMFAEGDLGDVTEQQKTQLQKGVQNSDRMINLINNLLDVTKIEDQKFQYKLEPLQINDLIKTICKTLQTKADKKNIALKISTDKDISELKLDKEKIKIALTNIIDNSIKYSPEKSNVEIKIENKKENNKNSILITVIDNGYGIPEEQQKQIFSKFFRGSNILKIETDLGTIGTGLGLYIAKDIITKHDGDIWFESEENKGTKFFIRLPI